MTTTAADEIQAAAGRLRSWVGADTSQRWAPSATARFGPELLDQLDQGGPEALRIARLINAQEQQ